MSADSGAGLDRRKSRAFARQASADYETFRLLSLQRDKVPECHRLQFLQMACEKLCKAHEFRSTRPRADLERSHQVIEHFLPTIARQLVNRSGRRPRNSAGLMADVRRLARAIEQLTPSVVKAGTMAANCEYPWVLGDAVLSPLDYPFPLLDLLNRPSGVAFVTKLLPDAIRALLPDPK